jgi:AcrR family transcriptional regulator
LVAARTVLAERGFEGLTIEAVANQANVSRTLVPYHFGSRAGLVAILIDSLFHDAAVGIWRRQASGSGCGSLPDFLEMVRLEAEDVRGQKDFFELIVCALREDLLRQRVAALLVEYRQINVRLAGVAGELRPDGDGPRLTAVGAVLQAIADGLALQAALDPDFDLAGAIEAAEELMSAALRNAATDSPTAQGS